MPAAPPLVTHGLSLGQRLYEEADTRWSTRELRNHSLSSVTMVPSTFVFRLTFSLAYALPQSFVLITTSLSLAVARQASR
jgi:hypothetical protein